MAAEQLHQPEARVLEEPRQASGAQAREESALGMDAVALRASGFVEREQAHNSNQKTMDSPWLGMENEEVEFFEKAWINLGTNSKRIKSST